MLVITLVLAASGWAQRDNPPDRIDESRGTLGQPITVVEHSVKDRSDSVEQQIKILHEKNRQAALKGDTSFLEQYVADNYADIGGDGSLMTKDQDIQMMKSGAIKYEEIDERDVMVHVYGDTAIINALAKLRLTVHGNPISGNYREIFVWVRKNGKWREVCFQATAVRSQRARPGDNLGHDAPPAPY